MARFNLVLNTLLGAVVAALAFLVLTYSAPAHATTTVHVEWMRNGVVYGSQTISATGSSVATSAAPSFGGGAPGEARISVTAGAAAIVAGPGAVATQTNGVRVQVASTPLILPVQQGDVVAIIEASDAPAGPPVTATTTPTIVAPAASTTTEACHVFKASAGTAYGFSGYIGAAGWIMIFDAASAPVDGAVSGAGAPKYLIDATAAGTWGLSFGSAPASFAAGVTVCASSTGPFTKTAYATASFSGQVQ